MKKTLFLFSVVFLIGFSSCIEGPRGPAGRDGRDGRDGSITYWSYIDYLINTSHWTKVLNEDDLFLYYECVFSERELDDEMLQYGIKKASIKGFDEEGSPTRQGLPYIINHTDSRGDEWFQTIECDYSIGRVVFRVKNSDFRADRPSNMEFNIIYALDIID